MDKLKKHFSLADWDFRSAAGTGITTANYVSPPSSLRQRITDAGSNETWAYLKSSVCQSIPQGRILIHHYARHYLWQWLYLHFRTQALPTNLYPANTLFVDLGVAGPTWVRIGKIVADALTILGTANFTYTWNLNQWYHYRVTWYTFISANLEPVLRIIVETEISGNWVEQISLDTTSLWEGQPTNLVGFTFRGSFTTPTDVDDTEIWKAIS